MKYLETLGVMVLVLLTASLITVLLGPGSAEASLQQSCQTLYFINAIKVYNSLINDTLLLETPQNITLAEGFTQSSIPVYVYNLEFNETLGAFTFNVSEGEYFFGFFISRVNVCYADGDQLLNYYLSALSNPRFRVTDNESIPPDLVEEYVKNPYHRVVEVVVPAFESWFTRVHRINVSEVSKLGIAVNAAYFVDQVYFKYNASALPRTIDQVIDTRQGDCDDISRVLVELLNYYGIPAVMASGYVYIGNMDLSEEIGNTTYIFIGNGPHAFVLAYIPGLGWGSLDFLAGSLIDYPFIFEGYTRETVVNESLVSEVVDFHRKLSAIQIFTVMDEYNYTKLLAESPNMTLAIEKYFDEEVERYRGNTTQTALQTTTVETTTQVQNQTAPPTSTTASPGTASSEMSPLSENEGLKSVTIVILVVVIVSLLAILVFIVRRKILLLPLPLAFLSLALYLVGSDSYS